MRFDVSHCFNKEKLYLNFILNGALAIAFNSYQYHLYNEVEFLIKKILYFLAKWRSSKCVNLTKCWSLNEKQGRAIALFLPCNQESRKRRNPGGCGHKLGRYWWLLSQALAEASHLRIQFWHCWLCMFERPWYPCISVSQPLLSHHGMMIS